MSVLLAVLSSVALKNLPKLSCPFYYYKRDFWEACDDVANRFRNLSIGARLSTRE